MTSALAKKNEERPLEKTPKVFTVSIEAQPMLEDTTY